MRRIYPPSGEIEPDEVEPDDAYAYPVDRPWLRANMVSTLDGAAAGGDGLTASVSGEADRRVFAALRRLADVVLVGAGTARAEGYRPAGLPIAVVTGRLDLDLTSPLFTEAKHRTIVFTCGAAPATQRELASTLTDLVICGDRQVDVRLAVDALHARGFRRLLCEGGPTLLRHLVAAGLLDELCLTVSPYLTGGGAMRILAGSPLDKPAEARLTQLLEDDGWLFSRYQVLSS
jgi:riboflavin biosynthesis pyrimidine reductase